MGISYDPPSRKWNVAYEKVDYKTDYPILPTDLPTNIRPATLQEWRDDILSNLGGGLAALIARPSLGDIAKNAKANQENAKANEANKETNKYNSSLNTENQKLNETNTYKNQAYDKTVSVASTTKGGDYTAQREAIRKIGNVDSGLKSTLENYYKAFYSTEKLQQWDSKLGAKPPSPYR